jgi:hypothetical protein
METDMSKTIELPIRRVLSLHGKAGKFYQVMELIERSEEGMEQWAHLSKPYAHSTSAFAALGRLIQKDTLSHLSQQ